MRNQLYILLRNCVFAASIRLIIIKIITRIAIIIHFNPGPITKCISNISSVPVTFINLFLYNII